MKMVSAASRLTTGTMMVSLPAHDYEIKRTSRARTIRIAVHPDGKVVVSAPRRASDEYVARVVGARKPWIDRARAKFAKMTAGLALASETVDRRAFLKVAQAAVGEWAGHIGVRPAKISIRKMRSRWGSCSREGNISLNLQLGHLPPELLEYVAVHELCHIVHHNHSKSFWTLVGKYMPDFKSRKTLLRRYGYLLRR